MTKYLLTMIKKETETIVGCIAVTIEEDRIQKEKLIIDTFEGKDLKAEIFAKWSWIEKINDEDKVWISSSTQLDAILTKMKDKLLSRVVSFGPTEFLNFTVLDLMNRFSEKAGKDPLPFELNCLISSHLQKINSYFEENPKEKRPLPILTYLKTSYENSDNKITMDTVLNSCKVIKDI